MQADGLNALARVGVPADHRGIICDRHVFRILEHWLKAGEPDPFYNPLNDYVILPTAFEIERHSEENKEVASVKEEWEIISSNCDNSRELPPFIGDLSVNAYVDGKEQSLEEARATIVVHPQSNGVQNVELQAVSVATVV